MNVDLIDAFYYGAIFIFGLIGILGLSMEVVLRQRLHSEERYKQTSQDTPRR